MHFKLFGGGIGKNIRTEGGMPEKVENHCFRRYKLVGAVEPLKVGWTKVCVWKPTAK